MRCSKLFRYFGSVVALTIFSSRGGAQTSVAAEIDTGVDIYIHQVEAVCPF
jgi:hypothetical protein